MDDSCNFPSHSRLNRKGSGQRGWSQRRAGGPWRSIVFAIATDQGEVLEERETADEMDDLRVSKGGESQAEGLEGVVERGN